MDSFASRSALSNWHRVRTRFSSSVDFSQTQAAASRHVGLGPPDGGCWEVFCKSRKRPLESLAPSRVGGLWRT
ncbi:MAG: hypothetical protein ACJATT_005620 [Myxococcota bacterium]|jgi:hypothetical protein